MLISFSGIDGCGKTLQIKLLKAWLKQNGKPCFIAKAYDDMAKVILRPYMETWTDDTAIMFLFQALHAQQHAVTAKALSEGNIVVADRWDESYFAYHENFGFLADRPAIREQLNSLAFHDTLPDIGFVIEVPPKIARRRRESRGQIERFEDRSDHYYQTVQSSYRKIALERNWVILNGIKTPEKIHREIIEMLGQTILSP